MNQKEMTTQPYRPIAVGFFLLAVPLILSIFLSSQRSGQMTNGIAALLMILLGLIIRKKTS